ncbi:hypothetical protein XO10_05445 [Marinitoga sp. 1135]|uniref:DUF3307 domain-containing protein n=2 Tax=Marinitoga TaxID=160798 RepID=H2J820_MARPK|nr:MULTISPECIES: hypothetical protein [Marinitoga]AEX85511.1 Protein of unknown function (DUF3307) [Marinitoga piezophila KA3]APT75979.1 hypothetical protein LN42_06000 [Marinitoga sp. 1137]NUU95720.1 hypothetical protein [Marinitoga sp. 1135]NUU97652.1 hypothetical protein [Marinitoga sp. 1138]
MIPLNGFLAHFIADHAFTNVYSDTLKDKNKLMTHILWSFFVILTFTFESLKSVAGIIAFFVLVSYHVGVDIYRSKKGTDFKKELAYLAGAFLINVVFFEVYIHSYISKEFVYYLIGMMFATSFGSFIERTFNIIDPQMKDTAGASERLAIYIFLSKFKAELVLVSIFAGLLYRFFFVKEKSKEWIFSPIYGVIVSSIWILFMNVVL